MDTNYLADLRALSQTLNFSRAAEFRNITQPAFGRRIRSLEAWCGVPLVNRRQMPISLTTAGQIMLDAAEDVIGRLERARREIEQNQTATASLVIAATHALSFNFFPSWINSLGAEAATHPLRLLSDNMEHCEKLMLSGDAQFLLCHAHAASPTPMRSPEFQKCVLARDRLIPVCGRDSNNQPLYELPGTAERPTPHIAFEEGSGMARILTSVLFNRRTDLHLSSVVSSHHAMTLKSLAMEGKGLAWIPESLARNELKESGRLVVAGGESWHVEVDVALFRTSAQLGALAETFWQLAQDTAATGMSWHL